MGEFGEVASAAYGATLGGIAALGWIETPDTPIDQAWLDERALTIDLAGTTVPVRASLKPPFDPAADRTRG
jgi:glycine cleavage system aminomethyltransferase T